MISIFNITIQRVFRTIGGMILGDNGYELLLHTILYSLDHRGQYHGCSPDLQRRLRNKLPATKRYMNRNTAVSIYSVVPGFDLTAGAWPAGPGLVRLSQGQLKLQAADPAGQLAFLQGN